MCDYTKWKRLDLEKPGEASLSQTDPGRRKEAERQTNNDLRKSIQQLICDVHEEASTPNLPAEERHIFATRRMVSMMGRVALAHERNSTILIWLTGVLTILTLAIVGLTIVLIVKAN